MDSARFSPLSELTGSQRMLFRRREVEYVHLASLPLAYDVRKRETVNGLREVAMARAGVGPNREHTQMGKGIKLADGRGSSEMTDLGDQRNRRRYYFFR